MFEWFIPGVGLCPASSMYLSQFIPTDLLVFVFIHISYSFALDNKICFYATFIFQTIPSIKYFLK
jgi:hypothetical protein